MARVKFVASETAFEPFANGTYPVEILSMEVKKSSTQNDMIATEYKVTNEGNRKLFDNFSLLPQAGWKLKNMLEAAGVPHTAIPGSGKGEFELDFDTADAIGAIMLVKLSQETYKSNKLDENGQPKMGIRNSIDEYIKTG